MQKKEQRNDQGNRSTLKKKQAEKKNYLQLD